MAHRYCAFILRYWPHTNGEQRIEITHIQSGDKTVVASLPAILGWISARCEHTPNLPPHTESGRPVSYQGRRNEADLDH